MTLPSCADLQFSCNAAVTSWQAWQTNSTDSQDLWERAWQGVVGQTVAHMTSLPIVLTFLSIVCLIVHIGGWCYYSRSARTLNDDDDEFRDDIVRDDVDGVQRQFWAIRDSLVLVTAAADSANLFLLSDPIFAGSKALADGGGYGKYRPRFWMKVLCCSVPGIWFKVSALQYLYSLYNHMGSTVLAANVAAVVFAFLGSVVPIYEQGDFLITYKYKFAGKRGNPTWPVLVVNWLFLAVCLYFTLASAVRFWGVWHCPSHIFQILEWGCMDA